MHRLLKSPQQLAAVLNGVADAITAQDASGRLIYANDAAARALGFESTETLLQTPLDDINRPFDILDEFGQPLSLAALPGRQALEGIQTPDRLVRFKIKATGEEHWSIVKARPVYDQDGSLAFAVNIFQDITRLKLAEQALAEHREQLRVTLQSIGDAVMATDIRERITFMNPVAEALTGCAEADALGQSIQNIFHVIHEETREAIPNPVTAALEQGESIALANHSLLLSSTGRETPIEDSSAPIRNAAGDIIGAVLVFHDVTERRRAEAELRASEARFRTMADQAPVLIWMAGVDKRYHYFNRPWLDFTGRTIEQERGYGWADNVHPDDHDRCMDTYNTAFDARQAFTLEYRLRNRHGEYCWMMDNGVPLFAPDGSFTGYIGSCMDITERREHEQRTLMLQQLTAALAGAVTAEEVAKVMAGQVLAALGGHLAAVMQLSADGECLEAINLSGLPTRIASRYTRLPLSSSVPITDAVRSRQPVWIDSVEDYAARYPHIFSNMQTITQTQAMVCLPLMIQERLIGAFGISFPQPRKLSAADRALIVALAQQCAQALERARLHAEAQKLAAMNERQRLARDLHDAVSQTLFSASVIAESLPRLWEQSPTRTLQLLEQLRLLNRGAMAEMRSLLVELRPEALINTRLETLLAQLADTVKVRKQMDISLKINLQARQALPSDVHIAFYRIAQEALTNIIKHAGATEVVIELNELPRSANLTILDNGAGFNPRAAASGIGLASMRERAEDVNARLRVVSRKGKGTRVTVSWPRP